MSVNFIYLFDFYLFISENHFCENAPCLKMMMMMMMMMMMIIIIIIIIENILLFKLMFHFLVVPSRLILFQPSLFRFWFLTLFSN